MKLKAEAHSENLQKMNEQELIRIKEVSDKKESLSKESEQKLASGSAETSEKVAANATAAAMMQEALDATNGDEEAAKVIVKGQQENEALKKTRLQQEKTSKARLTATANEANTEITNSQNTASGAVGNAETGAAQLKGQSDADAQKVEAEAVEAANAGIRQLKVEAEQAAGVVEKHILADESAYVDSGEKMTGTDMENLENAVLVSQGQEQDAQAALDTARTALEEATATLAADQSQVQLVVETKAAEAQKAAETIMAVTKGVKQQADIVKTNLDASEKSGKDDAKAAKDATASLSPELGDDPTFWTTSLIDESLGEYSKIHQAHQDQQADLSAADPGDAVLAAFPMAATHGVHDWRSDDLQLLLHDSLGDDDVMDATTANTTDHLAKAGKETSEVVDKHNEQAKQAADNQPTAAEVAAEEALNQERMMEATQKATNKAAKAATQKAFDEAKENLEAAVTKANEASANKQTAVDAPANTAYSNCQEANAAVNDCGELKIRASPEWKMNGYLKFPQSTLRSSDAIVEAKLKLYKFGGGTGAIRVFTASCEWDRKDITYTMAEVNPGGLALADAVYGDDTAIFPAGSEEWLEVKLHGDILNNARIQGNHICLRISGGPADPNDAVIIASELTDKKPELVLFVKEGAVGAAAAVKPESALTDEDRTKIEARGQHRLAKMAEYKKEEEAAEKQKVFVDTTAPDSPLTNLKKKLAVVANVPGYESLYDAQWAGVDDAKKLSLQAERDAFITEKASAAPEVTELQKEELAARPAWVEAELQLAINQNLCCADDAAKEQKKTDLADDHIALMDAKVATLKQQLSAPPSGGNPGGRIYELEQANMETKVDNIRAAKKHTETEAIKDIRCQTADACELTSAEIGIWEARAEARLVSEMTRYDNEHGTAPLSAHDVMQAAQQAETLAAASAHQEAVADVTSGTGSDVASVPGANTTTADPEVLLQLTDSSYNARNFVSENPSELADLSVESFPSENW